MLLGLGTHNEVRAFSLHKEVNELAGSVDLDTERLFGCLEEHTLANLVDCSVQHLTVLVDVLIHLFILPPTPKVGKGVGHLLVVDNLVDEFCVVHCLSLIWLNLFVSQFGTAKVLLMFEICKHFADYFVNTSVNVC